MRRLKDIKIAVVGLGYVGLPLAVAFGSKRAVLGFDIDIKRVESLAKGVDKTLELDSNEIAAAKFLSFSSSREELRKCNCFIMTVPTPVDAHYRPDFSPLVAASETIGGILKVGDVVIYESTVYPGATEEICVPILERFSGLRFNESFFVGYSPERVNPGDKVRNVTTIKKITSGSTPESSDLIDSLYNEIIVPGTHKAQSIKVAEAAKIIENIQRDINIALINELAMIFNKMGIDTDQVLQAASTKWNFLPFKPGLVGGHCIGVDPYYLTHIAQAVGYHPEIILAGRRINNGMSVYVVSQLIKAMSKKKIHISGAKILLMGLSFKEDCPDIRNTRVIDVIEELKNMDCDVDVYDPWVSKEEAQDEFGFCPVSILEEGSYDAVIIAVAHHQFKKMGVAKIKLLTKENHVIYDLKSILPIKAVDLRL